MEEYIFRFNDCRALQIQDNSVCNRLYHDFWTRILQHGKDKYCLPTKDLLHVEQSCSQVRFYAKYASAVIVRRLDSRYSFVTLVGLDRWESAVHASEGFGRESTSVPDVCTPARYDLCPAKTAKLDEIFRSFDDALRKSDLNNTGERRRQSAFHQGNQKTPSFARTILSQVLSPGSEKDVIQGGTTDVGPHTGCVLRNTSFPVVLSVTATLLRMEGEETDEIFCKCVSVYLLSYLDEVAQGVTKFEPRKVDRVVTAIREVGSYLRLVSDVSFKETVVSAMETHRFRLDELRPCQPGNDSFLSSLESVSETCSKLRAPAFSNIPALTTASDHESKMKQARADMKINLGWSDLSLLKFTGVLDDAWIQIAKLNSIFWDIATKLEDKNCNYSISRLHQLLQLYSKQIDVARKASSQTAHVMTVVLSSYDLLAAWICYCRAYRIAEKHHPLLQRFGPALDPGDLKHIVLDDARSKTAVECVQRFLKWRMKNCKPFSNREDTLALAQVFGLSSKTLVKHYSSELQRANELIAERWAKIEKTKQELNVLDAQLTEAEDQLRAAEWAFEESGRRDYHYERTAHGRRRKIFNNEYYKHQAERNRCQNSVISISNNIRTLEAKPPDLLLGLPRSKECAVQWLFFLYMPQEFRDMSALAQLSQCKLWNSVPQAKSMTQNLLTWYSVHRKLASGAPSEAELVLGSKTGQPSLSTPGIRSYSRETGVFFPDSFSIDPSWVEKDPFTAGRTETDTTLLFTEELPQGIDRRDFMQKFVAILPTATRENEGIVKREMKPEWLTHEQFTAFTTLRAGPYSQIRSLVESLHDILLPFEHECVHVLVKQLMYHIGDGWKVDLEADWNGLARISENMNLQVEQLRESPKDCDRLLLFGIVSSFYGQFNSLCKRCAGKFAKIARSWAEDVGKEVLDDDVAAPELYWKQAKFYGYALLCHSFGELDESEYLELAKLIVLFRSKVLFASTEMQSASMDQPILQLMACRVEALVKAVHSNLEWLTVCLSLAVGKENVPSNLTWSAVTFDGAGTTACFEAQAENHFSLNLLNGTALVNGIPLGLLPNSVVDDPLYRRTFGERNFEMEIVDFRHYRTARPVQDRFLYEFLMDSSNVLHIFEKDTTDLEGSKLVLLRKDGVDLPRLLQEKHSHWYSHTRNIILLRGPMYRDRSISFAITEDATYKIPPSFSRATQDEVIEALPGFDVLLRGETQLATAMSAFEYKDFVHVTVNPERNCLHFSLPRYKLSFRQQEGIVSSVEFKNFNMQDVRLIDDTLPGLRSSVILNHPDGREKVLISQGLIGRRAGISINSDWHSSMAYHTYDVHPRFGHLIARDTVARLHLAGLYASGACEVSDRRLGKPGHITATELVRQSWKNEPLTVSELEKLKEVFTLSNLSCTLSLACSWLSRSSQSVDFLHLESNCNEPEKAGKLGVDQLALEEYRRNPCSPRLLPCEELTLLGTKQNKGPTVMPPIKVRNSAVLDFVRSTEIFLREEYVVVVDSIEDTTFPLDRPSDCVGLEADVYRDIDESYSKFCKIPRKAIRDLDSENLRKTLGEVETQRRDLESLLVNELNAGDCSVDTRLLQLTLQSEMATSIDILRFSSGEIVPWVGPSPYSQERQVRCIDWALLCVIEDKLHRILSFGSDNTHATLAELECVREWNPFEFPRWVAFEVEQILQIRPNQYSIVRQLKKRPGSVIQLNMGLGKTRVLVPMLVLDCMSADTICRVNVLPSIIHEAIDFYRIVLVASIQRVKLFTLPFDRSLLLDEEVAGAISDEMTRCKFHRGFFVVTAQQRNSLLLKQYDQDVFVKGLEERYTDVLDESDAILDEQFQLVYALGTQVKLPAGPDRWTMLQALIMTLCRTKEGKMLEILNDASLVHKETTTHGAFPKVRTLLLFKRGYELRLGKWLCEKLLRSPPYELFWAKDVREEDVDILVSIMSDPDCHNVAKLIEANGLFEKNQSHILAARGFIAYGLLFHGLQARYRVNYGLYEASKTKMAVPYSASDTPKPRAQYSHPDMEIVYTTLSYFHEGLTKKQLKEALVYLQAMGPVAQKTIYREFVDSVRRDVAANELSKFDDIIKIDLSNSLQFELMYKNFRYCMEVICFWTNNFVYPSDTDQFLSRRATSAWNVCDPRTVGFSGTKDKRFLLPLSVSQISPEEEHLRATDGEMIRLILDCTRSIHVLSEETDFPMWQNVLMNCAALCVDALIDVAGLMAGSRNNDVALFLAERLGHVCFRGIVYFDTAINTWCVYETENRRSLPLRGSSYTEAECFVYYDECRCRGSDMKLREDAVALVTLEPKLTKDKFLQGCARMRKLRRHGQVGQSLVLAGSAEVVWSGTTTKQVLERILHHTALMTKKGVLTFYQRGIHFYSFPKPIESDISLEAMYGHRIPDYYQDLGSFLDATCEVESMTREVKELKNYCERIGQGVQGVAQLSEECEQELENDEECEEEEELEIAKEEPYAQTDWLFEDAFLHPDYLFETFFTPLKKFVRQRLSTLIAIEWSDKLYCTPNFWQTIRSSNTAKDLSSFLRPVNAMLVTHDGKVALISAYELDKLLPIWWRVGRQKPKAVLQHLCTSGHGEGFGCDSMAVPPQVLTFVKMFRGYVQYSSEEQVLLEKIFRRIPRSHEVVQQLLSMRSRLGHFDRSDLEMVSRRYHSPDR